MTASDSFPYVEGAGPDASKAHLDLKGKAVYWLLTRGFDLKNIDEEHYVERETGTGRTRFGYTDIHAQQDGHEVFIECEVGQLRLSRGGKIPADRGEAVFVFTEDGIHRLTTEVKEADPSPLSPREETIEREKYTVEHMSGLPLLDLSAYKETS